MELQQLKDRVFRSIVELFTNGLLSTSKKVLKIMNKVDKYRSKNSVLNAEKRIKNYLSKNEKVDLIQNIFTKKPKLTKKQKDIYMQK